VPVAVPSAVAPPEPKAEASVELDLTLELETLEHRLEEAAPASPPAPIRRPRAVPPPPPAALEAAGQAVAAAEVAVDDGPTLEAEIVHEDSAEPSSGDPGRSEKAEKKGFFSKLFKKS
jgi:hypothetical protein